METLDEPHSASSPKANELPSFATCQCEDPDYEGKISGQKKALAIPTEHSKLYDMLDGAFQMNIKYYQCKCESEVGTIPESGLWCQKKYVPSICSCPGLLKKRWVLRIIRNDVYQRMNVVKKIHSLLLMKNEKIEVIMKRKQKKMCSPYVVKTIHYRKGMPQILKKWRILKTMNEVDVPKSGLIDRKKLMENIGEHRILPKKLQKIYIMEEIANKMKMRTKKRVKDVCTDIRKKRRDIIKQEKFKCKCKETVEKIRILEYFINLIANLHPVIVGKEEPFDNSECKRDSITIEQLIKERKKYKKNFLDEIAQKHKKVVQELLKTDKLIQENEMMKELIQMLEVHSEILNVETQNYEKSGSGSSLYFKLEEELEILKILIIMLKMYLRRDEEGLKPDKIKLLLGHINRLLKKYLQAQEESLNNMEKLFPGFNIAMFDDQRQKDEIVIKKCRDENEKIYKPLTYVDKLEDLWESRRQMLKMLTKPQLHAVAGYPTRDQESKADNDYRKKDEVSKIQKFKKKVVKLKDVGKCPGNTIKKHKVPKKTKPSAGSKGVSPENRKYIEWGYLKMLKKAYLEGRKIVSQPEHFVEKKPNLMCRKRLLYELELEKGMKLSKYGSNVRGKLTEELKKAYETEHSGECKCVNGLRKLNDLMKDVNNIIMHPEEYHIKYMRGPEIAIDNMGVENIGKFLNEFLKRKKKHQETDNLQTKIRKRSLKNMYGKGRFQKAWQRCWLEGMFVINWEAQFMVKERIIIRPQYEKRVKVLSGGKMGLEPLYGEYVSRGMLDGVVLGDYLQGPIPRVILQAILTLNSGQGVVIIILNESEAVSFIFAIERAHKLGVEAELVLAKDDISERQPAELKFGLRGHSGIILQYKIAAGMASKGHNLAAISRVVQNIQVATIAYHLSGSGSYLGSGIRGKKGHFITKLQAKDVLHEMLRLLIDPGSRHSIAPEPDTNMIILINHSKMKIDEVYGIISSLANRLIERGAKVGRVYHGSFTSIPVQGFSITLAKDWNNELIQFLDLPSTCLHWPPHYSGAENIVMRPTMIYRKPLAGASNSPENISILMEIMDGIVRDVTLSLNKHFDKKDNLAKGLFDVCLIMRRKLDLNELQLERPYLFLRCVGKIMDEKLFCFGKLLRIVFLASAQEFLRDPDFIVTWGNWCMALKKGTEALVGYTKFRLGQGKIIDYLEPVSKTLCKTKKGWSPLLFLRDGLDEVGKLIENRKNDAKFMVLDIIFKNIYQTLLKYMSHFKGEDWWKARPSPRILLVDPDNKNKISYDKIPQDLKEKIREKEKELLLYSSPCSTVPDLEIDNRRSEPSIEAISFKDIDGESVSIRSSNVSLEEWTLEDVSKENIADLLSESQQLSKDSHYSREHETENNTVQEGDNPQ